VTSLFTARTIGKATKAADTLHAEGPDAIPGNPVKLDVTSEQDIQELGQHIEKEYDRLDILTSNAGIAKGKGLFGNSTLNIPVKDIRGTSETNFIARSDSPEHSCPTEKERRCPCRLPGSWPFWK
jgi:NAD(P)-dependent dehydrogenase (short-subunit alcohol dehydrogenase family)